MSGALALAPSRRRTPRLRRVARRAVGMVMMSGWIILPLLPAIGIGLSAALRVTILN